MAFFIFKKIYSTINFFVIVLSPKVVFIKYIPAVKFEIEILLEISELFPKSIDFNDAPIAFIISTLQLALFTFCNFKLTLFFAGLFLWVFFNSLSKAPIVAENHPMIEESYHFQV